MPKKEKERHETKFFNFKVDSAAHWSLADDIPNTEVDLFVEFAELSEDGVKVSFGSKKDRNGYSVSVTLPNVGDSFASTCSSFWDGNRYDAWAAAYIAVFVFDAKRVGWDVAQEAHDKYVKEVQRDLLNYRKSK